jgi:hypothetical protein
MTRKVLALLVSSTMVLGMNGAAWAQSPPTEQSKSVAAKPGGNPMPLAPGGAAGIKQAQGTGERIWNIVGIAFIVGVAVAMIVVDGDDPEAPSTGTN